MSMLCILVVRQILINFTHTIDLLRKNRVNAVTKLRNEIYVLHNHDIYVFEGQDPFCLQKKLDISYSKRPYDLQSCEKENCIFVSDSRINCIFRVTRETGEEKPLKLVDHDPRNLSVSSDGQVLVINRSQPTCLTIFRPGAKHFRSIELPRDVGYPVIHAVETSTGNFIILSRLEKIEEKKLSVGTDRIKNGICEVTGDGQTVIRRLIPSSEMLMLNSNSYLALDDDDRVFVADNGNGRVILLDFDLTWNRILCPVKEETKETKMLCPNTLYFDKDKKQLIVGGVFGVNVYTLSRT